MKRSIILFIVITLLFSCGGRMSKKKSLDNTLYQYAKVIRWGDFDTAMSFLSPEIEEQDKPSKLSVDRLKQFRVSTYQSAPILPGEDEDTIVQNVKIKFYNLHTKREKIVLDQQLWKYYPDKKSWLLMSGIPQLVK